MNNVCLLLIRPTPFVYFFFNIPLFYIQTTAFNKELYKKEKQESSTVIKCKVCQDIFYDTHASTHTCFLSYVKKKKAIDPTKNCSVEDCRYGLNCRVHSLEEKRKVKRPYPFDLLSKNLNVKKKKVAVCEVDEDILRMVNNVQPVVNKIWHWPSHKYETFGFKNIFCGALQKKRERK